MTGHDWLMEIAEELDQPEPRPLLADAKVGDLCQLRNGIYEQIERRESIDCVDYVVLHGCYYDLRGKAMNRAYGNIKDIISTEPLAPKGTKDWAWQMMLLGKKICHRKAPSIYYHKPTHYVKRVVRENCTDDMSADVWHNGADTTGWQLYEPEPKLVAHKQHANCLVCGREIRGLLDGHATVSIKRYSISSLYDSTYSHYCGKCFLELGFDATELELRNRQQPMAEPPKEQFKVGDWVLIENAGVESQQLISKGVFPDSINAGGIEFYSDGTPVMQPLNAKIIRKLDPSEVRVTITLEGTVHKIDGNNLAFELEDEKGAVTCVGYQQLDPDTEKLVRELADK